MSKDTLLNGFNDSLDRNKGVGGKPGYYENAKEEIKLHESWIKKSNDMHLLDLYGGKKWYDGASDFQKKAVERLEEMKKVPDPQTTIIQIRSDLYFNSTLEKVIEIIKNLEAK